MSTASNAASLLINNIVDRAANFVLYLLVGRYLGTFVFGQMTLALTLFYLFQIFSMLGLKKVIIRAVASDKSTTNQYLLNGSVVVLLSSTLAVILQWVFTQVMGYSADTRFIIFLFSLGLIPISLITIFEAVFQAWERMHYITIANMPVNIIKIGLAWLLFQLEYGIIQVALIWLAARIIIVGIEWWLLVKYISKPQPIINTHFAIEMLKSSRNFLAIDSLNAARNSLNTLILSKLASETEVGLLNSALQFSIPVILIITNIGGSIFPVLCKEVARGIKYFKQVTENTVEILLALALPASVGLFFLASPALEFLYGEGFEAASGALKIIAWTLFLRAITQILGLTLLANKKENIALRITIVLALAQLIFGIVLTSQFGLIGAAWSELILWAINFLLHYFANVRYFFRIELVKLFWKPTIASLLMAVYLFIVREQTFIPAVISAAIIYAGVLFGIATWSAGGLKQLKVKYNKLWLR